MFCGACFFDRCRPHFLLFFATLSASLLSSSLAPALCLQSSLLIWLLRLPRRPCSTLARPNAPILRSTWLLLKTTLPLASPTASSSAISMLSAFFILLNFGHVARSPALIAPIMNSGVGLVNTSGNWLYGISGKIVMSPLYLWLKMLLALVNAVGKICRSASTCIRCNSSPFASTVAVFSHPLLALLAPPSVARASAPAPSSERKKGVTCGLTCDTMKWLTLNISARRAIGRSLSTEPSIQRCAVRDGDGPFQGTLSPVVGSLARIEEGVNTKGTEQEVALFRCQHSVEMSKEEKYYDLHCAPDDDVRRGHIV